MTARRVHGLGGPLGAILEGYPLGEETLVSKHEAVPGDAEQLPEEPAPERRSASDRRVQIAAAKLRVVLDERLKRPTPEWVKRLAEQKLAS
jgi:hypothetical protein